MPKKTVNQTKSDEILKQYFIKDLSRSLIFISIIIMLEFLLYFATMKYHLLSALKIL